MTLLILTIYVLAVARVTRLINADTILDRPRAAIATKAHDYQHILDARRATEDAAKTIAYWEGCARRWSTALYFVQCPWCVGMWLTLASAWAPLYFWTNPIVQYVGVALAASHLIGVFARFADTEDIGFEDETVS